MLKIGAMISPNEMKLKLLLGTYNTFLLRKGFAKKSIAGMVVQHHSLGVFGKALQHVLLSFPPHQSNT